MNGVSVSLFWTVRRYYSDTWTLRSIMRGYGASQRGCKGILGAFITPTVTRRARPHSPELPTALSEGVYLRSNGSSYDGLGLTGLLESPDRLRLQAFVV